MRAGEAQGGTREFLRHKCANMGVLRMTDADLETLLIEFLRSQRDQESDLVRTDEIMRKLETLPRQAWSFWIFDYVLIDWKLDLSWPRVVLLVGCAAAGLVAGAVGPVVSTLRQANHDAIAYVMPTTDCAACAP
jgi:hypothetical protein